MDLYLIAHKVRGEPAFDIAERLRCPNCQGVGGHNVHDFETGIVSDYEGSDCSECDGIGYWWIIGTSGHRAYPLMTWALDNLVDWSGDDPNTVSVMIEAGPLAIHPGFTLLPDLYPIRAAKPDPSSGKSLLAALGLLPKVVRRL